MWVLFDHAARGEKVAGVFATLAECEAALSRLVYISDGLSKVVCLLGA